MSADGIWLPVGDSDFGNIGIAAEAAVDQANQEDFEVLLVFNDTHVVVKPGTDTDAVVRAYAQKRARDAGER